MWPDQTTTTRIDPMCGEGKGADIALQGAGTA
jgi:hypothetical protein